MVQGSYDYNKERKPKQAIYIIFEALAQTKWSEG